MKRNEYTQEFKKEAVALSNREGIKVRQVALELGIRPEILYRCRAEMRNNSAEAFPGKGRLKASDEEVRDLKRELERVHMGP